MPPVCFQYGLLPPHEGADIIERQMTLAHRYRNKLIEIERRRRMLARDVLAADPRIAQLNAELAEAIAARDAAREQIKAMRAASRSRSESAAVRTAAKELAAKVAPLVRQLKDIKREVVSSPDVRAALDALEESAKNEHKAARASCGVYWGTYLLEESAMRQARGQAGMPEFRRRRRGGSVGVQIQKGIPLEELWGSDQGGDQRIRIERPDDAAWDPGTPRGVRRRMSRTVLRLRIGSTESGRPIWGAWRMIMHRPLPAGCSIKAATVVAVPRNCWQMYWTVSILVDAPAGTFGRRNTPPGGRCAVNLGFAMRDFGIRAGYVVGDDGYHAEILVPFKRDKEKGIHGVVDALSKCESIRGFRDRELDSMKSKLAEWWAAFRADYGARNSDAFAEHRDRVANGRALPDAGTLLEFGTGAGAALRDAETTTTLVTLGEALRRVGEYIQSGGPGPAAPGWLTAKLAHICHWRSLSAARQMSLRWRDERFTGDDGGFAIVDAWRAREDHLECYESGMRRRALLARREIFRIFASKLASRYRDIVIDNTDLSALATRPKTEDEAHGFQRSQQRLAAGSLLRLTLQQAFGADHWRHVSSVDLSRTCSLCGAINEIDHTTGDRMHRCVSCREVWDQDRNFCLNALKLPPPEEPDDKEPRKPSAMSRMRAAKRKASPAADAGNQEVAGTQIEMNADDDEESAA